MDSHRKLKQADSTYCTENQTTASSTCDTTVDYERDMTLEQFKKRYTFQKNVLGQGGQAYVKMAYDNKLKKNVAIKIFKKNKMSVKHLRDAKYEKKLMEMFDHPNIMKHLDYFEDADYLCIVMDLMTDDLRNFMVQMPGAFREDFASRLFALMLQAVHHCHQHQVIHRDIKLENFLMDVNLQTEEIIIKLTDFGLSKIVPDCAKLKGRAGTFITMAPETITTSLSDSKVDCWSLGVVLFELLTGSLPFYHQDPDVLKQMVTSTNIDLQTLKQTMELSDDAIDLLSKLLEKNPKKRISAEQALQHPWITKSNHF